MTPADIKDGFAKATAFLDAIEPIARAVGGEQVAHVASVASAAVQWGSSVVDAVDQGRIAMAATDVAEVRDLLATLQLRNDALAEAIASS